MRHFFKGLAAAVAGGVLNSITDAQVHRGAALSSDHLGNMAMTGAVLGCAAYIVGHMQGEAEGTANARKGGDPITTDDGLVAGEQKENHESAHPVN